MPHVSKVALLANYPRDAMGKRGIEANIAHQLYDSLLTEVQIVRERMALEPRVPLVIVGEPPVEPLGVGTSLTAELRRRFLVSRGATFRSKVEGCFERVFVYPWSCDRSLDQVAANATEGERERAFEAKVAAIEELRHLAYKNLAADPPRLLQAEAQQRKSNFILYARSDTMRRRLLNASEHFSALQGAFGKDYNVLLWEDEVLRRTRSLDEQIDLVRHASRVITLHGTWPSIMGLLLPRGASTVA